MPRVTAAIEVARPAEDAFAIVADPTRRRGLLPDNFRDFRILSDVENGPGTRTGFRIITPQGEYSTEIEVTAWDPPRMLTEQALGASPYTMRWSFEPSADGAHVSVEMDYTIEGSIFHRIVERWFARRALEQSLLVELMRLKQQLDDA